MRRLLLLRHAKSSWAEPGASDHARPLNRRGQEAAPRIGAYLNRHKLVPDSVLCSTAQRTRETWELVAAKMHAAPEATYVERLYDATPRTLLDAFRHADTAAQSVLVVGHNPGLQELAARLAPPDSEARHQFREKLPTAAIVSFSFDVGNWKDLKPGTGQLQLSISPATMQN